MIFLIQRKRGMIGTKVRLGHTHYWVYDNPLKIKQQTEVALYRDVEFINDNLVQVSQPDFMVAQSIFDLKNQRRSIGSSDFENGNDFTTTLMFFGSDSEESRICLSSMDRVWRSLYLVISAQYSLPKN